MAECLIILILRVSARANIVRWLILLATRGLSPLGLGPLALLVLLAACPHHIIGTQGAVGVEKAYCYDSTLGWS